MPEALAEAEEFLSSSAPTLARLERVAELIDGFETPYGMELLSTVHWVAMHDDTRAIVDSKAAADAVAEWNERKKQMFKPEHVEMAWTRLKAQGWFVMP
jgi:hypothetical protein